MRVAVWLVALCSWTLLGGAAWAADDAAATPAEGALSLVVMDPLALPLSCPCVEGYAQRDYEKLAAYLSERLHRPVQVTFAATLQQALERVDGRRIDLVIGKDSVVRHEARIHSIHAKPIAQLAGANGLTTQSGLIVVRSTDPAQSVEDLQGYRVLFGPADCDEKSAAARNLFLATGVEVPSLDAAETTDTCSDSACKIIEWGDAERAAAVISSYAEPLLEGCGTIEKGELRVVGETMPVPFITAFATDRVDELLCAEVVAALLEVTHDAGLKTALETLLGFVPIDDMYHALRESVTAVDDAASPAARETSAWPGWGGASRDGRVPWLPASLPQQASIVWRQPLHRPGLGGIAATDEFVLLGDRDVTNMHDEFRCYSAADGELLWSVTYPAPGKLDYDNTPRATPLIHNGLVYCLGAFGDLTCIDLASGLLIWQKNLIHEFDGDPELVWGLCSSPLVVDGKLIVNPGGPEASVVALDPLSGTVVWKSPGERHAYSSFVVGTFGGVRQLVGLDATSLGGWDIATGRRLWTLKPPHKGDFNVPTPAAYKGQLLVTSENNGTRLYAFDDNGRIIEQPIATFDELAPDTSSPIVVGKRAFCMCLDLYCLDLDNSLRPIWIGEDKRFREYSPLLASDDRVLAVGIGGELILVDAAADEFRIVSQLDLFPEIDSRAEILSQPALVGTQLYFRGERDLICVELAPSHSSN